MNQDHRTIQEIRALLGSAPEVQVPPRLDEEVRSKAVSWARKRRVEEAGISTSPFTARSPWD